jgi:hypothetical protein
MIALVAAAVLAGSSAVSAEDHEPAESGSAEVGPANDDAPKFGLTLEQRKAVFAELADAERRAETDAESDVHEPPESMEQVDRTQRLAQEYKAAVAARHGLTQEQAVEISAEGMAEGWEVE